MSKLLFTIFLLLSSFSFSQDYTELDNIVRNYQDYENLEDLTFQILRDFKTGEEQVRAAFVWVTHNISYFQSKSETFEPKEKFVYYSEYGKKYQIRKNEIKRIDQTLKTKLGVCIDYSLILNEVCSILGFPSKIISGIAKTSIKDTSLEQLYKNHAWNAVYIDGSWQLMDPTWGATRYWDPEKNIFIRKFQKLFFFTTPLDFLKNHFPGKSHWQLVRNPITVKEFMASPIYYPYYFLENVKLVSDTKGIREVIKNQELYFSFDHLPKRFSLKYSIDRSLQHKRMRVQKLQKNSYRSKLRLRKNINADTYLTIFLENKPILDFKLRPKSN